MQFFQPFSSYFIRNWFWRALPEFFHVGTFLNSIKFFFIIVVIFKPALVFADFFRKFFGLKWVNKNFSTMHNGYLKIFMHLLGCTCLKSSTRPDIQSSNEACRSCAVTELEFKIIHHF